MAVVGHQREAVGAHIHESFPDVVLAVQEEQHGTGHAVRMAVEAAVGERIVRHRRGGVRRHARCSAATRCATSRPSTRPRSARSASSAASSPTRSATAGCCATTRATSRRSSRRRTRRPSSARSARSTRGSWPSTPSSCASALPRIGNDNAKGEYYLTDTIAIAREDGLTVGAHPIDDVMQTEGVNDRVQLARIGAELNRRIVEGWMREGVTVMDPATTWIDADVVLAADVTILPGTQLLGATVVGEDAVVGPDTTLKDCEIGAGRPRRPHPRRARRDRRRGHRRPVLLPAPRHRPRRPRQDRRLRRDQERRDRRRRQGAAPVVRRRRRDRRGHQHRRRHDLRQLRRRRRSTARRSASTRGPAPTTRSSRRSRSATGRRPAPAPSYARTSRRARSRSSAGPQRNIEGWALAQARRHRPGGGRRGRAGRRSGRPVETTTRRVAESD